MYGINPTRRSAAQQIWLTEVPFYKCPQSVGMVWYRISAVQAQALELLPTSRFLKKYQNPHPNHWVGQDRKRQCKQKNKIWKIGKKQEVKAMRDGPRKKNKGGKRTKRFWTWWKKKNQKGVEKYQHKRNVMRYSKSSSAKVSSKTNEKAPFHFFEKSLFE